MRDNILNDLFSKSLNLKFEIDCKEWVTKYTEIWIGPFSLTKKEVEILNEIQMIYLQLEEAGKVTGEIESFLFENRFIYIKKFSFFYIVKPG